jgi:adenylate cyclase
MSARQAIAEAARACHSAAMEQDASHPSRPPQQAAAGPSDHEAALRSARLVSGLVLMAFVTMHIANHALGLVSPAAAEAGRVWFLAVWRNPPATFVLYGAMLVHVVLVLRSLYLRRTLALPAREAAQTVLGLMIPLLVAEHVAGTRIYHELTGIEDSYDFVVRALWIASPEVGARQAIALVAVWAHGCLGLHFWLRYRPWYDDARPWLLAAAVLLPTLALLGFADMGQAVSTSERQPLPATVDRSLIPAALARMELILTAIYAGFAGVLALLFAMRALRQLRERRDLVDIRYQSGEQVQVPKGTSVLEASRIGGIPHHSACGGRGRCSTCRIRIVNGGERMPAPGQIEMLTLQRIRAAPDIRLACQLRPDAAVSVVPLLAAVGERSAGGRRGAAPGREQEIAVLFCDIRGFTALADHRLPYDVVFLLNRYFAVVGKAVEQSGGRLDKFIGDGAMALFGLDGSREEGCRQAISAASLILADLARLGTELAAELAGPLRVAIGIHAGPAIVGSMGYGDTTGVTAIGDTVNVASRLEAAAKEFDAAIVISRDAADASGFDLSHFALREIAIRGSARPLDVRVVPQGAGLALRRADEAA